MTPHSPFPRWEFLSTTPTFTPPRLARHGIDMAAETTMATTTSLGLEQEVKDDAKDP